MNSFIKINKNLISYSIIFLIIISTFGFNFLVGIIGNILLLLLLIPILLFLIAFLSFNFLKSKLNYCNQCGNISLGNNKNCINCGANIDLDLKNTQLVDNAGNSTIEVKAEEIK